MKKKSSRIIALVFSVMILVTSCFDLKKEEIPAPPTNENSICLINNSNYSIYSGNTSEYSTYDEIKLDRVELDIKLIKNGGTYTIKYVEDGLHLLYIECWSYGQKVLSASQYVSVYGGETFTLTIK